MQTAKIFKTGNSQAVRIPKEFRLAGKEVYIRKVGNMLILEPKKSENASLRDILNQFDSDFRKHLKRDQPPMQKRKF